MLLKKFTDRNYSEKRYKVYIVRKHIETIQKENTN